MSDVVIASAVRTAGGRFGGAFKDDYAVDLGALTL
jgi:acetyl-CoA acetyltransferase